MSCRKKNIKKCIVTPSCESPLFLGDSWRCNDNTTTSTTSTSTTSTTSSSTTSTTTTIAPKEFTIINNSQYDDLQYFVYAIGGVTTILLDGFVNSGDTRTGTYNIPQGTTSITIYVKQIDSTLMYIQTLLYVNNILTETNVYNTGTIEFQWNNIDENANDLRVVINDTTPLTTTSTTSTTTTTSTSTTSTSTTSTTTSSTTTSTTTQAPDNLIIRIKNIGSLSAGLNTRAWNIREIPPFSPIVTQYYPSTGATLAAGNTQTFYNGPIAAGNKTRVLYQNTSDFREISGTVYWSTNNGASYTLLHSFFLPPSPPPPTSSYPEDDSVYLTIPNNTGINNILEIRIIPTG